ncbi:hypothetical protein ACQI5H_03915 [Mycobacterium heidelbergense]|uniref:hypothetical protein n=1 Tax=Mycobacterium heidelbergense TaxID=53376 RepID=UPI003CF2FCF4
MTRPSPKLPKPIAYVHLNNPGDLKPVRALQRGLAARLRDMGLGVQTESLREMRVQMGLDMQVVYVNVRMPIRDGVTLRVPVMATIAPRFYSPTQAQHLDSADGTGAASN